MEAEPREKLDKRIIKVWKMNALITAALEILLLIAYVLAVYFFNWWHWPGYLLASLAIVWSTVEYFILPIVRYRYYRYDIRDDEVEIQRGIFIMHRVIIPMARIQHVKTEQGPIMRRFQLATLEVSSAATSHQIPGLAAQEASRLRGLIAELAKVSEEDV